MAIEPLVAAVQRFYNRITKFVHDVRTLLRSEITIGASTNHSANSAASSSEGAERTKALALQIAGFISDSPASNTIVIDVQGLSSFADYFVICSGENERQLDAIASHITNGLAAEGVRSKRAEGSAFAGWILLDYGDVIVHIFDVEQRAFYRLESLWSEAPTLLAIQ
jgi:ribosome-associated protein